MTTTIGPLVVASDLGDAASGDVGVDIQAYSAKLNAIAGMTWAADKGFYSTSSSAVSTFDLTSFARTILDDTNAAGVLSTLGITGAIIPGTADSVAAMGLITPATSGTNGITWKAGSSTWGQAGWSAAAGDAAYGTEQVWSYHKYGTGSATDLLLARLDAAGGIGATALHIATGRNAPSWWSAPTQCAWINPYVDTTGLVISAPTTTNSATWASNFISCTSGRSGSQLELFGVGSSGLISSADGLNAGTNVTARYGLSTQAYIGNVFGVAGLGLGSSVDTYVARIAAGIVGIGNALQLPEMTPPAGSADTARICARDLSGVTQAVVVLPDSSVAPIANALRVANNQTGTTYTLAMTDFGEVVEANNASAVTVTIPANASVAFPVGTVIRVYQMGAGQVTVAAAGGVTLRAPAGAKTVAQYATIELWKRATNEWTVAGQTTT